MKNFYFSNKDQELYRNNIIIKDLIEGNIQKIEKSMIKLLSKKTEILMVTSNPKYKHSQRIPEVLNSN